MIREHRFNSAWWGEPVGIVDDARLFELPAAEQATALRPYAWVEFRSPLGRAPAEQKIAAAGFIHADTQLHFRIGLTSLRPSSSLAELTAESAAARPFRIDPAELAPFDRERFALLPGATQARLDERYARWCNDLIAESPEWAVAVSDRREVQGWFVSQPGHGALRLALAMLRRGARISGLHLYQRGLLAYAASGARIGAASFSVSNIAVLNVYAKLGAHFTSAEGCWIRVRP